MDDDKLFVIWGTREKLLPGFDERAFARSLVPLLDRGDRAGATALWRNWRERAVRVLERKRLPDLMRQHCIEDLSTAVRLELIAIRGSAALGPVPVKPLPTAPQKPSATVFDLTACRRARGAA
ncbi:hypothetical protein [Rhodobacter capsulatus]|jgi:hypothetical protein|uniref:Uncharacterized protein n=1 Tax=Rhodobacter capsulatus (strain ATCC BAA-309 / NBRC 16581 / SB1003) TaxID=272942 RepID=D5APV6_RHOCB|nr:hypothetical protein [Rhodobacter capsulatus]ADE86675.1 conserved hypothetical protein [Rhodobacter capsulatus SB 1003]ETD00250.1 hypothetical protein U714_16160 [Rhodobacter capsulatus DE442]ETD74590.1 hypothetical protein U717_16125 [Rhodobacter capsulatus R121]ETE52454.1 hypothetical protein U715_16115 [Rhodobacter capsulatus Y262]MDS0928476.1 hypothetical protein [Rhodobacter capsulatus]